MKAIIVTLALVVLASPVFGTIKFGIGGGIGGLNAGAGFSIGASKPAVVAASPVMVSQPAYVGGGLVGNGGLVGTGVGYGGVGYGAVGTYGVGAYGGGAIGVGVAQPAVVAGGGAVILRKSALGQNTDDLPFKPWGT